MAYRTQFSLALGLSVLAVSGTAFAQSTASEKLGFVASVSPQRVFYCEATPQSNSTNKTLMVLEFDMDSKASVNANIPLTANMTVTGSVEGRFYSARIGWRGNARLDGSDVHIILDDVASFDADALPGKARWSDPADDVIRLRVEDHKSPSNQPFILRGTQETELGANDLKCLDGPRR